jgi:hypothetical protein
MVDQGRQQALNALIAAPGSAEKTFATDSALNRQLLGDVIVSAQAVDADGKLVVSGTALPGSTVRVTLPDGTTQSAVADNQGVFTLTSATVQPTLETPLNLVGSDGLSQPAPHIAPSAPHIDTGNGKLVSGTGTPGSIVTVTDNAGQVVGTATVDALGQWSFVPATPLADNAALKAAAADLAGNVSGPGAGTVDVSEFGHAVRARRKRADQHLLSRAGAHRRRTCEDAPEPQTRRRRVEARHDGNGGHPHRPSLSAQVSGETGLQGVWRGDERAVKSGGSDLVEQVGVTLKHFE